MIQALERPALKRWTASAVQVHIWLIIKVYLSDLIHVSGGSGLVYSEIVTRHLVMHVISSRLPGVRPLVNPKRNSVPRH